MLSSNNLAQTDLHYQNYLKAVREGAFAQASQVVQTALAQGVSPVAIYDRVFAPSLRQVGELWETGEMSVAQEHLATGITEYCRTTLANSSVKKESPQPAKSITGRVLLTNVVGNQHTLGLNMLCDVFRWQGWEVFPLITALPESEIAQAANLYKVDLVCLSIALPGQIARATAAVKALRQNSWKGIIEVGGPAFVNNETAFELTGADFLGTDAAHTVQTAERLLAAKKAIH